MNVATIRDGLKARVALVTSLRHTYDTVPNGEVVVPAAVVVPDDDFVSYAETIGAGIVTLRFRVTLLASMGSDRTAQDRLDAYLSTGTGVTSSVVDALIGDRTLGGAASTTVVTRAGDYGITEVAGNRYWKVDLFVSVTARRA